MPNKRVKNINQDKIENMLVQLCTTNSDIDGGAVVLQNSQIVPERLNLPVIAKKLKMVSSLLLDLSSKYSESIRVGNFKELHIKGHDRSAVVYEIHNGALILVVKNGANLGLVNIDGRETAKNVGMLVRQSGE